MGVQVTVQMARLDWPYLFKARELKNDDGSVSSKFQGTLILPPNHISIAALKDAQRKVAIEAWGQKAEEMLTVLAAQDRAVLHDGALKAMKYERYRGMLYVSCNGTIRPSVAHNNEYELDTNGQPKLGPSGRPRLREVLEHEGLIYAGVYVNALVDVFALKSKRLANGKTTQDRISAAFTGLQFVQHGDAFGGGAAADTSSWDSIAVAGGPAPWQPTAQLPSASALV